MRKIKIISIFLLLVKDITLSAMANAQNINNRHWDYQNVLVLGVGADWNADEVKNILKNYHFDKVVVISEGNVRVDAIKAGIEKLGIPTGGLEDLKGKNIKQLYAHSWGSSRVVNFLSMTSDTKVSQLHCMGSPESPAINYGLKDSLDKGIISKVFFHLNEGDPIPLFGYLPKISSEGGYSGKIEFHYYKIERQPFDTKIKEAFKIPIFNAPLGFDKYFHYNCQGEHHGPVSSYLENMKFSHIRDPEHSAFRGGSLPEFYTRPSYFVSPDQNHPGKSMNEAQILTEMLHNKHKALIVGKGSEADLMYKNTAQKLGEANVRRIDSYTDDKTLQFEARRFGADVILGVKGYISDHSYGQVSAQKPGGVWIAPKPSKAGKGGSEIKKRVIKSRPSEDALSWPVELPKEAK